MRKSIFLSLLLCLTILPRVAAQSGDPVITIQRDQITVAEVLQQISDQSGMDFSYNAARIDAQQEISFSINRGTLSEALDLLASKIPVSYRIIDEQIILNYQEDNTSGSRDTEPEEYHTLSGFISDKWSGENLIGATVSLKGTGLGTTTNAFGFYSLRLPKGACQLLVSYLGFDTQELALSVKGDERKDWSLLPASLELPSVVVSRPLKEIMGIQQAGQMELTPNDLDKLPEFAGETGLIKGLQSLPGIKMHSDGSAFFFARGGEKDQNLVIIDDAPIYNPSHLFGFYSIVVPDFTRSIKVYKSDIPANLGDRLSSIVDIRTKDGNLNKWELRGAFNPMISRFSVEGPIVKKKGALFFSFRRSNFQWIYGMAAPNANLEFGDFNFKWNHKLNDKNRLYFTLINSSDVFFNGNGSGPGGVRWGNFATTLRWNHIYGPKWFSNTIAYIGSYNYELSGGGNSWQSGIGTLNFKTDFTYYANPAWTLKFGLEAHGHFFNPGRVSDGSLASLIPEIQQDYSQQRVWYQQSNFTLAKNWQVRVGLRGLTWKNQGPAQYFTFDEDYNLLDTVSIDTTGTYKRYLHADPRLSLQYDLNERSYLKASYGIYHQFIQLISNSDSPFSALEVWLPSSPNIKPQRAAQAALTYFQYLPTPKLEFTASAYYKHFDNLIDYKPHAKTLLNPLLEGELRFGTMRAYGAEFLLRRKVGRLNGWLSYTYSRAIRQTAALNGGREYPAFQDRPHDFSVLLNYQMKRRTFFSAYWTAYSGSAYSSPTGFYIYDNRTVPIYDEKNNDRLPAYQRLDIAFKFILNKDPQKRFQHSLTFSIYNFLGRKNTVAVNFNKIPVDGSRPLVPTNLLEQRELITTHTDLVRFFPSLTYKFKI